jgi:Zn-dependent protease
MENQIQKLILLVPPMLIALTAHECAHAWTADKLGDPTARMLGRITLNPIKHLDPIGTLALFLSGMFGWAKPVPVNPRYFRDPTRSMMWVALAGPASNFFLAALFALAYKIMTLSIDPATLVFSNVWAPVFIMVKMGVVINVSLGVFNIIPVPPLDGSKALYHFLPYEQAKAFASIERYGFVILMLLIISGVLHKFMSPVVMTAVGVLTGGV